MVPALQRAAVDALNGLPGPNRDGAIVMVDPRTGAVLAMASSPSYDPTPLTAPSYGEERAAWNAYHAQDAEGYAPIYPLATYNAIPPGSTAKVVTTAAIFNLDPVLASYDFPVTRCLTNIPDTNQQICNDADTAAAATPCGGTIAAMLPESCDPGYAKLGLLLGADHLARQAELFGFNAVPPLDLPAGYVQPSRYPNARQLSPGGDPGVPGQAYSAFGQQDVATTALENVLVAAGIANGGAVMAPHFLAKVTDAQGQVVKRYRPHVWRQATSGAAAANVIPLMEAVATSPSGTASGVGFPPALHVAVKTGTAQVGYPSITSVADWMIGFAPATNPRVAIAVVVPSQPLSTAGATIAGPIVKTMLLAALAP